MQNFFSKLSSLLVELYYFILYSNETLIVSDYSFEQKVSTNERILYIKDVWNNFRNNLDNLERIKREEEERKALEEKKKIKDEQDWAAWSGWRDWDCSDLPRPAHPDFEDWEYKNS